MAFDLSTAKPVPASSGGFDISSAQPASQAKTQVDLQQRAPAQDIRARIDEIVSADPQIAKIREVADSFRGVRDDVAKTLDEDVQSRIAKIEEIEGLRGRNPVLAEQIEETGGAEALAVGAGRGLTNIGRAIGLADQEEPEIKEAFTMLGSQQPIFEGGEVLGEAAPFLAVGGPISGLARTTAQKVATGAALGAAEGGAVTKGRGGNAKQVALGTILGGTTGGAIPVGGALASRARSGSGGQVEAARELLREPTNREVAEAVAGAAPSSQDLREASKAIYNSLSEAGISVSPETYDGFIAKAINDAKAVGFRESKLGRKLTPQSQGIIDVLEDMKGGSISFDDLEGMRRAAQNASGVAGRAGNMADANINSSVVDSIDDFMATLDSKSFTGGPGQVSKEVAAARNLWGRARRSEVLDEALELAKSQQSGFENGIRIQFKRVVENKKKSRFFKPEELEAMKQVERGTTTANTLRRIGKLGWGEGKQNTVLNALASGGLGGAGIGSIAAGGPLAAGIGLILLPTVGTISGKLARKLTEKKAQFANQLIRAGDKADDLTRVYLRNTPVADRNADDLAALLMRPDLNLSLVKDSTPIIKEAITKAERLRQSAAASSGAVAIPIAADEGDE